MSVERAVIGMTPRERYDAWYFSDDTPNLCCDQCPEKAWQAAESAALERCENRVIKLFEQDGDAIDCYKIIAAIREMKGE